MGSAKRSTTGCAAPQQGEGDCDAALSFASGFAQRCFSRDTSHSSGRSIRAPDREGDNFSDSVTSFPNSPPPGGAKKTCLAHRKSAVFLFGALIVSAAAQAEVLKFINHCAAQQQLCPSYQLVLTPPDGWVLDAKASAENKVQIMVPKGQSLATAEPLIYVQGWRLWINQLRQSVTR